MQISDDVRIATARNFLRIARGKYHSGDLDGVIEAIEDTFAALGRDRPAYSDDGKL